MASERARLQAHTNPHLGKTGSERRVRNGKKRGFGGASRDGFASEARFVVWCSESAAAKGTKSAEAMERPMERITRSGSRKPASER